MNDFRIDLLEKNSVFWSKLGYCYDPPRLGADGKQILFASDFERFKRIQKSFTDAGIRIVSSILPSGWIGIDQYDYELTDRIVEAVFSASPDAYYIPRIKLNVPVEWCRANPEEVFAYYDGPRDVEGIRRLVGTEKHDILGYDSPHGYQNTFGYTDDRPNMDGKIALQSFSSEKWRQDAGEALGRVVDRLENGPYAKRIIAYHLAYGVCGETCVWGRFRKNEPGDWGIRNRKAFYEWGVKHYGSPEKLREAWACPDLTPANTEPFAPANYKGKSDRLKDLLRGNRGDCIYRDYECFSSDVNVDAMEHFGRIAKTHSGGKPVGYFYGYVLECDNAGYSGWLNYDRILNSSCIDFIAAPKSYYRNAPGEPGGFIGIPQSLNGKKLYLDEIDNPTHLEPGSPCSDFRDTRSVLWREFSKNLAAGSNFWWMDLGGGWYDSPEIMAEIARIEKMAVKIRKHPHRSIADTLLVVDEYSLATVKYGTPLHHINLKETIREFNLTGGLIDIYRLSNLEELDLSPYRLIVNVNTFSLSPASWQAIKRRIPESSVVMWNYAPGVQANGFSLENISALTGFKLKERSPEADVKILFDRLPEACWKFGPRDNPLPHLEVEPRPDQTVIGRYEDGGIAVAREGASVFCAFPVLKACHLRSLMQDAGCHFYGECGTVVYGDSRFIATFKGNEFNLELTR